MGKKVSTEFVAGIRKAAELVLSFRGEEVDITLDAESAKVAERLGRYADMLEKGSVEPEPGSPSPED